MLPLSVSQKDKRQHPQAKLESIAVRQVPEAYSCVNLSIVSHYH